MPVLQGSSLLDAVQRPLDTVRSLFDQANQPVRDTASDWGVEQYFKDLVSDPVKREQVPLLTPETAEQLPNHSLCRFRGMVQDMMDPEYYIGAFKQPGSNWQTTKYSDNSCEVDSPSAETVVWDRKPLYCTRVPGQSQWVVSPDASVQLPVNLGSKGAAAKRGRDAEFDEVMEDATVESAGQAKVARTSEGSENVANETNSSTLPDRLAPQKGDCIVFVYERNESLKLNDVVEFVGVLSRMPELAAAQMRQTEDDANENHLGFIDEELAARPPTSLVPRMHAITAVKLKGTEDLPLIAYKGSKERQAQVAELRATALSCLQTALGGDRVAAEYLLLQMVSRIYSRTESTALGALSLGLTNCPSTPVSLPAGGNGNPGSLGNPAELSQFGRTVTAALATLVPRVIGLPISIDKLNGSSWRPARDVKTNRLLRAPLQLADNTHVVLDEALLQAGQLTALGVNNLKALKDLLDNKKIEYDFSFYTLPMSADVPVTVLSSGKSLLHTALDVVLPLHPTAPFGTLEQIHDWSQKEELRAVRAYIGLVRDLSFSIQQPMTSFLENDLTAARQRDSSVSTSTMHTWLTVARLLALSHGEDELTPERWAQMRELEHSREQRIRAGK